MDELQQTLSYDEQDLIVFEEGLFGFEDCRKYLPMAVEEDSDAVICFQSVEEEHLSFILMNPFLLKEDYHPVLSAADREALGMPKDEELSYYVICVLKEPIEETTVNLKCPVVINVVTQQARQVILDQKEYDMRHALKEFADKEGASC